MVKSADSPCREGRTQLSSQMAAAARSIGSCEHHQEKIPSLSARGTYSRTRGDGCDAYGFGRVPRAGGGVGAEEVRGEVERRQAGALQLHRDILMVGYSAGARRRRHRRGGQKGDLEGAGRKKSGRVGIVFSCDCQVGPRGEVRWW